MTVSDYNFWYDLKVYLVDATGISRDGLHVLAGVAGLAAAALVTWRPIASLIPWTLLLIIVVMNEAYDLAFEVWPEAERDRQWSESFHDFWNTMLAPTLLMVVAKLSPSTFGALPRPRSLL
ncbi:MAG TPA: hypothetical protein VGB39_01365 [Sphingomicrobium sp.]